MHALVLTEPGEEPSVALKEVGSPALGPHDVLVEVAACGFCYHDVAVMRGVLRRGVKPEVVLGHEISGRVAETGSAVTTVAAGDTVVAALTIFCGECSRCRQGSEYRCLSGKGVGHGVDGGFAQMVALPETSVVAVPQGLRPEDSALLACPIGVALRALEDVARLKPGETVLVTGAGGGLGVHAVQVASALGARVLAVTTSPQKVEPLEGLAIAEVVLAGELDYSEIVMALTEDNGVDVVFDTVGSAIFRSNLASLAQFGRMVLLGEITGGRASINPAEILFRDATIVGSTGAERRHIRKAAEMVAAGLVRPVISRKFALADAVEAYRLMRDRQTFGRVVLVP
ncbi:MAG: alcohol dehydrogenase catalytic domain-containing protein [Chloroflexi bacterium]|nr:alcohol dehydrogenase catalytic domain-containing protein [Chloroflexota bacterium]